jgi:hypothetical protein
MRLYVEELRIDALEQVFTRVTPALITFVRLHLCKYLSPTGTFVATIFDADNHVLAQSSQTLAEMQAAGNAQLTADYYHGHVTFQFDRAIMLRPGDYKLRLSATGYTYDPDVFIGWVKADVDRAIPVTGDTSPEALSAPFDFEMYALERVI